MATLNLGRIKPVFRGAYSGSTAYVVDDIVTHGNESFICIQAHGAGTQATSQGSYWTKLAAKGADGSDGTDIGTTITTQGDLLYRDGSGLQRLAKGTAGQALTMNTGATAPEWTAPASGTVLKQWTKMFGGGSSVAGSIGTPTAVTGWVSPTITPASASSKFYVQWNVTGNNSATDHTFFQTVRNVGGTVTRVGLGSPSLKNDTDYSDSTSMGRDTGGTNTYPFNTWSFMDAPNTTSAIYYQLYITQHSGTWYFGRSRYNTSAHQYTGLNTVSVWELDGSNSTIVFDTTY